MRRSIGFALFALAVGACLKAPPAIDPDAVAATPAEPVFVPKPPTHDDDATANSTPLPATECPAATKERGQYCSGKKVCMRDEKGCETCECKSEHDETRAVFEAMDPADMRQR